MISEPPDDNIYDHLIRRDVSPSLAAKIEEISLRPPPDHIRLREALSFSFFLAAVCLVEFAIIIGLVLVLILR